MLKENEIKLSFLIGIVSQIIWWILFKPVSGHSLAVQWLGLSAFTAMARVQSLVRELKSHKLSGADQKKKKKYT